MSRKELIEQARELGITGWTYLSTSALKKLVDLERQFQGMLGIAEELNIRVPKGTNLTRLEDLLRKEVAKRLRHVKIGNTVSYRDTLWIVTEITSQPWSRNQLAQRRGARYTLVPHDGGRKCHVMDTTLLRHMA